MLPLVILPFSSHHVYPISERSAPVTGVTHPGLSLRTDFVKALFTADDECALDLQQAEHLGKGLAELALGHAKKHARWSRRVDQRAKDVEHGAEVELSSDRRNVRERRVVVRRKEEQEGRMREEAWQL